MPLRRRPARRALLAAALLLHLFNLSQVHAQTPAPNITAAAAPAVTTTASLRCCFVTGPPYVARSPINQDGLAGLAMDYLNQLTRRARLTCASLTPFRDASGAEGYNALLGHLSTCGPPPSNKCTCDLGVGAWFEGEDRLAVDFLPPFAFDSRRVIVHVRATTSNGDAAFFLTAFSPSVWALIVILIILFAGLKLLDRRFAPVPQEHLDATDHLPHTRGPFQKVKRFLLKTPLLFRLRCAMQSVLSMVIGQSSKEIIGDFGSTRQWVLNYIIALSGLFLVLVYEATMTASLVQESVRAEFRSLDDFRMCRIADKEVCFVEGDSTAHFWDTAIAPSECRLSQPGNQQPKTYKTYSETLEMVSKGECKFMLTDGGTGMDAVHGKYCGTLALVGDVFSEGGLSYILPKGSQHLETLKKATLELRSQNAVDSLDGYFEKTGKCHVVNSSSLTVKKLKNFFIIAFVAVLVLFLEMIIDPQTRPRGSSKSKDAVVDKGVSQCSEDMEPEEWAQEQEV